MRSKKIEALSALAILAILATVVYAASPAKVYVNQTEIPTNRNTFTITLADTFTTGNETAGRCIVHNYDASKMCVSFKTVAGGSTAQGPIVLQPLAGAGTFQVDINEIDTKDLGIDNITHIVIDTDDCDGGGDAAVTNQIVCTQTVR